MCRRRACRGCEHGLRTAELPPPCARRPCSRKRSRSDQLPLVDSGCPHAVVRSHLSLVFAAGGGAGHPERPLEPAGSETPLLKEKASFLPFATTPCSLRHWESSSGFHYRILRFVIFSPGRRGSSVRFDPRLDDRPDPRRRGCSRSAGLWRQAIAWRDRALRRRWVSILCPGQAVFGSPGCGVLLDRTLTANPGLIRHRGDPRAGRALAAGFCAAVTVAWRAGSGRRADPGRCPPT